MESMETFLRAYCRRPFLLSKPEKYFYNTLREVFSTHTILAKVRLADLVEAESRHPTWQSNFNRVKSKQIDFIICDAWLCPLLAVELDGSSHQAVDQQKCDDPLDQILHEAELEIVHVPRQKRYFHNDIRQLLLPKLFPSHLM